MIAVWLIAAVGLVVVAGGALSYNRFVRQRQLIDNAWANVDTELRRRYDLVPNLVATVRGYAAHERETLEAVVRARAAAIAESRGADEQAVHEGVLTDALRQLLALRESYPELEASEQFLDLQHQLVATEDRIQVARRLYNANVRDYDTRVETFPSLLIARLGGFGPCSYFELEPAIRDADAPAADLES